MDTRAFDQKLRTFWREFRAQCLTSDQMYRYLTKGLRPGEASAVEEHLSLCAVCGTKIKEIREELQIPEEAEEGPVLSKHDPITEGFFDLLMLSRERLGAWLTKQFEFPDPVKVLALRPLSEAVAFAEAGRQFEKQTESADASPYDVEFSIFGNRLSVIAKSKSRLYDHSIVQFELLERDEVRFRGVLVVRDGIGRYETKIDQIPRPEKERFILRLQPIHTLDLLSKLEEDVSVEVLSELLKEEEPRIRKACVDLLANIGTTKAKNILKQALEDPDPEIRRTVRKLLNA